MVARGDLAPIELRRIKVADMSGRAMVHRQIEHLVEVAVVQRAIPAHGDRVAAHDTGRGSRIEGVGQSFHILFVVAALHQKFKKPADRHIGDRIEMVELDTMASPEFFSKLRLDRLLLGREKRAYRIAHEIQRQPAARLSVAELVEESERLDRFLKYAIAALRIGLVGSVIGQRCDDFHTMPGEELCQVRLGRKQQDRQVTAIHHMATQCPALFNQPTKIGVEFRRSACDIDGLNIRLGESANALLRRFAGHVFRPVRPRIDMAVPAGLIAELADIDLKHCDPGSAKRKQADVIELRVKGKAACDLPE